MADRQFAVWGFLLAGGLCLTAALLPLVRGRSPNVAFLGIGVVFLILGAAQRRRQQRPGS